MEVNKIHCSNKEHENIEVNLFCQECQIYMCNNCEKIHSTLFKFHHTLNINKDPKDIFTGFCKLNNHKNKLEYYCKDHSILCCGLCIARIKGKGNGDHGDCNICLIEDIKEEKKKKFSDNITQLKDLSKSLEESINKLKKIYDNINNMKEELKTKISKVFTKIRDTINQREDKLLLEVDTMFDNNFFKEEIIKQREKLPSKIKLYFEKEKINDNDWNDESKLNSLINDCINIENHIKDINNINENIKKFEVIETKIEFGPENDKVNNFLSIIKNFGHIFIPKKIQFPKKEQMRKFVPNIEQMPELIVVEPQMLEVEDEEVEYNKEPQWNEEVEYNK